MAEAEFGCSDRDRLCRVQEEEVIFLDNPGRWVLLPVEFPTIFKFYKALENQYWTPGPLIWDRDTLIGQISGRVPAAAKACSLAVYCVLIDLKLFKGVLADEDIDSQMYMDVLDQLCGITDYVQSPEARAFIGFQNMLEDFHREAINGCLSALLGGKVDPTGSISSSVCVPHIRHTWSKALWVKNHLNGLTAPDTHALPGDHVMAWESKSPSKPCLAEALVALVVSRCLYNASAVRLITRWASSESNQKSEGGGSTAALTKFLTHFLKDMEVFADFYAHLYANLTHKLNRICLFTLLGEAMIIEYQYLCTVFHELIDVKTCTNFEIGSLVKAAISRVVSACGESPSDFELFYDENEQSLVATVSAICWPRLEAMRGDKFDNSSLPFVMFSDVPGDWLASLSPITAFSTAESGYHLTATNNQSRGEPKMEQIPSNTTAASALARPSVPTQMEFDEDF